MTQEGNTDNELELLREHLSASFIEELGDLEETIERSELTDREYLAYVLAEATPMTGKESAALLQIEEGTYWGKLSRAREKMDAAATTLSLKDPE